MTYRDTSADTTLDGANMENEFKKWAFDNNVTTLYPISYGAAKDAWNARQTEIDDLKMRVENYKEYADGVSIQLSQANKEIEKLNAENERLRKDAEQRTLSVAEQIAQAKEDNADLVQWENYDPQAWGEAMRQDEILRATSKWSAAPFADRFAEVVRRVREILPNASTPPTDFSTTTKEE